MTNQTIAVIPINVADEEELRKFLARLVERLDLILGFRGTPATTAATQAQTLTVAERLLALEARVQELES